MKIRFIEFFGENMYEKTYHMNGKILQTASLVANFWNPLFSVLSHQRKKVMVQDCNISIANTLEIPQSGPKTLIRKSPIFTLH